MSHRDDSMPCGRCGCGVYCEEAAHTPLAVHLCTVLADARPVVRCKTYDRPCVGVQHFCEVLDGPGGDSLRALTLGLDETA